MIIPLRIFGGIGFAEIAIIAVVILLIFGARRLPEIGSSMGRGIRTFKSALMGEDEKTQAQQETAQGPNRNDEGRPY